MVVAALFITGDQVPLIPLFDIKGNGLKVAPAQIAATCVNVGVVLGETVTDIVAAEAQTPTAGVNA